MAVAYQAYDLLASLSNDVGQPIKELRIDGGLTKNIWLNQFLADMLNLPVKHALIQDTTIFGVSLMAGLHIGIFDSLSKLEELWHSKQTFEPIMTTQERQKHLDGWQQVLNLILK